LSCDPILGCNIDGPEKEKKGRGVLDTGKKKNNWEKCPSGFVGRGTSRNTQEAAKREGQQGEEIEKV